jgi:hypothetical protein
MKQVENLEGSVNYKLLKAKVSQQTLRRLDKNLRKSNPEFSFSQLVNKVGEGILDWLHPYTRLKIC